MRTVILGAALGLALTLPLVGPAGAEPTPGGGSNFGLHVAEMAPDHPLGHGTLFGECISGLATLGECLHHP